jgi:hypothetical protein
MNPIKKALDKKITGKSSKRQLKTESIPLLRKIADKEEKGNQITQHFGSFAERINKRIKTDKSI